MLQESKQYQIHNNIKRGDIMSITPFFHVYHKYVFNMANINKIKLSGTTYSIQDENATKTVELTQAQYDALTVKDPNTFYVITDATGGDLSNYYTKSETSGATQISTALASKQTTLTAGTNITIVDNVISATGGGGSSYTAGDGIDITNDVISVTGKVDTTTYSTYTAATDTALASKQTTLTAGTGISIVDNVISATGGGGGGKAVNAGTNISITTGETADTINCTLPISGYNSSILIKNGSNDISLNSEFSQVFGSGNTISAYGGYSQPCITVEGINNSCGTMATHVEGGYNTSIYGSYSHVEGAHNQLTVSTTHDEVCSHVEGKYNKVLNYSEHASGQYNVSNKANTTWGDSGNTLFSVGNGTADNARHNAFEIRQNGDIYLTKDGQDVKLQDQLGGTVDTEITSASTNPVTSAAIYNQFGGLKLVKLSQSEYDSLATKDSMTLYIIEETT